MRFTSTLACALQLTAIGPSGDPRLDSARALVERHQFQAARAALTTVAAERPADAAAAYWLGLTCYYQTDYECAARWLKRATSGTPPGRAYYWLAKTEAERLNTANIFRLPSLTRAVVSALERAVQIDPHDAEARLELISFYMESPAIFGGDKSKGRRHAADTPSTDIVARGLAKALVLAHEGDWPAAEAEHLALVRDRPDASRARIALGQFYRRSRHCDEARRVFDELAADGSHVALVEIAQTALVCRSFLQEASTTLERYLQNHTPRGDEPSLLAAGVLLARVHAASHRRDLARLQLEAVLRVDPAYRSARLELERIK